MRFSLVGGNHQTAPVTIREKVAISAEKLGDAMSLLRSYIPQGIILSTCNRTEIYTVSDDKGHDEAASLNFMKEHLNCDTDSREYVYIYHDDRAMEHLLRVACGLDSMIVGEFEVLGQVRQALEAAEKAGMVNLALRHIFQSAIGTGRRVREETGISKNAMSVSSVAIDLATRVVGDLPKCKMLVIGAGEAGRLVVKVARERGMSQIFIASRTHERAIALASAMGGVPIGLATLPHELSTANIVVTCAAAPHWILDAPQVEATMSQRPGLPLVIIDISLPRNVEPDAGRISNVFLYNIDDLTHIAEQNRQQREGEIEKATDIVAAELTKFASSWREFQIRPVVSALMKKSEDIRRQQLDKTLKKLPPLSDEDRKRLEAMTRSIVTKILEDPLSYLKANGDGDHAELVKEIFRLKSETS